MADFAGQTEEIYNGVIEVQNKMDDAVNTTLAETDSFLDAIKEAMNIEIPFSTWTFSPFIIPQVSVTADAPDRPDIPQEINTALQGVDRPYAPAYNEIIPPGSPNIAEFTDPMPEMDLPTIPDPEFPTEPSDPTVSTIARPTKPSISIPTAPTLSDLDFNEVVIPTRPDYTMPDTPVLNELEFNDVELPDRPAYTLPDVPSLSDVTIPTAPGITMPFYEADFPVADLPIPSHTLVWSETEYLSELITEAQAQNLAVIQNGGTPLGEEIETDIWERQAEKEEKLIRNNIDSLTSEYSGKAYDLPTGVLFAGHRKIYSDYEDQKLDRGRTMSIEQAKLALDNYRLAQQNGIQIEGILIAYHSSRADRSLQAARATLDAGIAIFNVKVQEYNTKVQAEVARAGIYDTQIKAELMKLEVFRSQIDAVRLQVDIDGKRVDIYRAQVDALNAIQNLYRTDIDGAMAKVTLEKAKLEANIAKNDQAVNIYKALLESLIIIENLYKTDMQAAGLQIDLEKAKLQANISKNDENVKLYVSQIDAVNSLINLYRTDMEATNIALGIEKLNIDIFGKKVDAYGARVSAEAQKFNAYKAKTEGEMAKATAFEAKARGYTAYVDGKRAITAAQIATLEAQLKANDQIIRKYEADIGMYTAEYRNAMERVRAISTLYEADANIYRSDIDKATAEARLTVEQSSILQRNLEAERSMLVEIARANLQAFVQIAQLHESAAKGGAEITISKLTAMLSSINTVIQLASTGTATQDVTEDTGT